MLFVQLANGDKEKHTLSSEKDELEEKYVELLDFRSYMDQHLAQMREDVESMQGKLTSPRNPSSDAELARDLSELHRDLEQVNQKMGGGTITDWNAELGQECQRLQTENVKLERQSQQLEAQLEDIKKQVQQMDDIAQMSAQFKKEVPAAEKEALIVVQTTENLESTPKSRSSSTRSSKEDMEMAAMMKQLQEDNNNLISENRTLKADLTKNEEMLEKHMESLRDDEETVLNKQLKEKNTELRKENQSLTIEMEDLVDDMEKMKSQTIKLERELKSTKKDVDNLKGRNQDLVEDMDTKQKELNGLRGENGKLVKEIMVLKKAADKVEDLQLLKDENERLVKEVEKLRDNNNKPEVVVVAESQQVVSAVIPDSIKVEEIKQLKQEKQKLEQELDDVRSQVTNHSQELAAEHETMKQRNNHLLKEQEQLMEENAQLHKDFQQLAKLLEEKHTLQEEVPYWNMSTAEYCARVREKIAEIKHSDSVDCDRMSQENAALRSEVGHLKDVLERASSLEAAGASGSLFNGKEDRSPTSQQIYVIRQNSSQVEKYQELESERDDLLRRLGALNGQSLRDADDYKTMEKHCQKLERELERLKSTLMDLKRENKYLKRESRQMRENVAFSELEKLGSQNAQEIDDENERMKAEVTRIQLQLEQQSLNGNPVRSDEETKELQSQLSKLQDQLQVSQLLYSAVSLVLLVHQ